MIVDGFTAGFTGTGFGGGLEGFGGGGGFLGTFLVVSGNWLLFVELSPAQVVASKMHDKTSRPINDRQNLVIVIPRKEFPTPAGWDRR